MRLNVLLAFLMFSFLFSSFSHAWGEETLKYVAQKVLLSYYPRCESEINYGAVQQLRVDAVNSSYGEAFKQHCDLQPSQLCPAHDAKWCETASLHCPAIPEASKWFTDAKVKKCCEQARYLAVSIFYHAEIKFVFNNVINENPACHEAFEQDIDAAILAGPENFSVTTNCTSPSFNAPQNTFTSKDLKDLIDYAKTSVIREGFQSSYTTGQDAWYAYNDTLCGFTVSEANKLPTGSACDFDANCSSSHCDHNVCCAGATCCPKPGDEGFPCETGLVCSPEFQCVEKKLSDGSSCSYDVECASHYCERGSASGVKKYCCARNAVGEKCCASDSDCAEGEECSNSKCSARSQLPQNATTNATLNTTANSTLNGNASNNTLSKPPSNGGGKLCPFFFVFPALFLLVFLCVSRAGKKGGLIV
ncbi:hypothetical protein HY992_05825 [Candidatus Micrarchaeota archaeon]|nr:hypothetical protein [Candidatus Micrarchaeota archaeon]